MGKTRFDTILTVAVAVLLAAVLGFGGYFGYTVYRDKIAAEDATPALRLIKVLKAQAAQSPNDAVVRVRLGEALAAAGRPQEAIEQLNAALKIDPKHTGAYLDLGQLAAGQNRPVEAERYFKKVIELTDGSTYEAVNQRREQAFYNLGMLALNQKKYEDAVANYKAALRIRNDASDTYYYLSRALYKTGEVDGAIQSVESALAFDPNFGPAHYFLGELYMSKGDKVNASFEYHRAATIDPSAAEPKKAIQQFGDPEQLLAKARSEEDTNLESALETVLIVRNLVPESAKAAILHGEILVKRKSFPDALDVYRQAAKLDPTNKDVQAIVKSLTAKYGKAKAKSASTAKPPATPKPTVKSK
jgi:tetratricopeptide (TPR) repeat protein